MRLQKLANQKSRCKHCQPLISPALRRQIVPLAQVCNLLFLALILPAAQAQESTNAKGYVSVTRGKSAATRNTRRSDADAGVQLLETIINRVMNIPQVALTKSNTQIAQNLKQQNSPTDFKLAIRPKESGKAFAAAPKLPLVIAQAPAQSTPFPLSAPAASSLQMPPSAGAGGAAGQAEMKGEALNEDSTTESWKGGALSRVAMKQAAANANSSDRNGLWENSRSSQLASADAEAVTRGLTNRSVNAYSRAKVSSEEARRVPDLATAVNRLYKTSKGLEDVQTMADSFSSQNVAVDKAKAKIYNGPREYQILDDRPVMKDMREITTVSSSGNSGGLSLVTADRGNFDGSLAPAATPARRQRAEKPASYAASKKSSANGAYANSNYNQIAVAAEPKLRDRRDRLALLPPSVATGIPGLNLNLGASEAQAMQALSHSGGKLKSQKIRNWIVYSWVRKDGDSGDALQLFFRHGLLDAIRIFDPELISSGFGVSPGDQLEVVKERFGEPAFLLPEPNGESAHNDTTGKNYIYPISQVGFQLARSPGESSPQVVSVLIFAVK
jgi:hypothetical protein